MPGSDESSDDDLPTVFINKLKVASKEHIATGSYHHLLFSLISLFLSTKENSVINLQCVRNKIILYYTHFFYKQHFYKQRQAEISKKLSKYWAIPSGWTFIHVLHPHYDPKIIGQALKNKQKNMHVWIHKIITSNQHENEDENEK